MTIHFACPRCTKKIRTSDNNSNKSAKCPKCDEVFIIPPSQVCLACRKSLCGSYKYTCLRCRIVSGVVAAVVLVGIALGIYIWISKMLPDPNRLANNIQRHLDHNWTISSHIEKGILTHNGNYLVLNAFYHSGIVTYHFEANILPGDKHLKSVRIYHKGVKEVMLTSFDFQDVNTRTPWGFHNKRELSSSTFNALKELTEKLNHAVKSSL